MTWRAAKFVNELVMDKLATLSFSNLNRSRPRGREKQMLSKMALAGEQRLVWFLGELGAPEALSDRMLAQYSGRC
jgi:hypothetical protein